MQCVLSTFFLVVVYGEIFMILLIYEVFNVLVHAVWSKLVRVYYLISAFIYFTGPKRWDQDVPFSEQEVVSAHS